MIVILSL